eukprot:12223481-Alexandrium_andersonii.AAC.1
MAQQLMCNAASGGAGAARTRPEKLQAPSGTFAFGLFQAASGEAQSASGRPTAYKGARNCSEQCREVQA